MASRIDFAREAFFRDPADGIAKLRASGPVVATRFPIVDRVWVTTTYEAATRVLKDSAVFTLRKEGGGTPARTHRSDLRAAGAVHALAQAPTGGQAIASSLAEAALHSLDRKAARCGGGLTGAR